MSTTNIAFPVVLAASLACACESGATRNVVIETAPTTPQELRAQGWEGVLSRITNATCDREQTCGTIGPGAFFKTRAECTETIRAKTEKGVNMTMCAGGVDKAGLDRCLSSLEAGACTMPGDSITRTAHCDASDLCVH